MPFRLAKSRKVNRFSMDGFYEAKNWYVSRLANTFSFTVLNRPGRYDGNWLWIVDHIPRDLICLSCLEALIWKLHRCKMLHGEWVPNWLDNVDRRHYTLCNRGEGEQFACQIFDVVVLKFGEEILYSKTARWKLEGHNMTFSLTKEKPLRWSIHCFWQ